MAADRVHLRSGAMRALVGACFALAGLAACSSDDFGTVGGSLPLDVSQDSLLVEIPSFDILASKSVVPQLTQTAVNREVLYLGNRTVGGWRATPLLRFDFSTPIPDSVVSEIGDIAAVEIKLQMLSSDVGRELARVVRVHALVDTLRPEDVDAEAVAPLLAEEITTAGPTNPSLSGSSVSIPLPVAQAWEWLQAGGHVGVALFDLTEQLPETDPEFHSNAIGLAAKEFATVSALAQLGVGSTFTPFVQVRSTGGAEINFPVLLDLTVIEHDAGAADALVLGSFEPSRLWLRFDLDGGLIPGDATVNRALLTLHYDAEGTIGQDTKTTRAFEALESELDTVTPSVSSAILRSASQVVFPDADAEKDTTFTVDVTEFVQRKVNLVVPPEAGILVRFDNGELFRLNVARFHGPSAPEALRPRLSVTFTPPADTWR